MPTYLSPGVYVEEVDRGSKPIAAVGTAVAAFVGFTAKAPTDDPEGDPNGVKPRLVTNWTQFVKTYGGFTTVQTADGKRREALLPHAVFGFFNNGGGNAYIVRIPHRMDPKAALTAGEEPEKALEFTAWGTGADADGLSVEITESEEGGAKFDLSVVRGEGEEKETLEAYMGLTLGEGANNVASQVNDASTRVAVAQLVHEDVLPQTGSFPLATEDGATAPVRVAVEPPAVDGEPIEHTGIQGLTIADDVTMLAMPDLFNVAVQDDGSVDETVWQQVQTMMIAHCQNQANRVAILDPPPGKNAQQVKEWRTNAMYDSAFASLYYPWIRVTNMNPAAPKSQSTIPVPPSGHLAGIWARNDGTRGVWKAPANEVVTGALDVERKLTKGEQDTLNPDGINCIRPFGTRGIRVWGGRTLSSDPSWTYLNVRRLFNMIEASILEGTQWVVFEPNDQALWARVKRTIEAFLLGQWRDGALMGASPDQAFYVKCDAETNPQESIDLGRLVAEIGIAPVKPAEFVIFRISQWAGGSA
jgi:phage tail sheath protein FI